MSSSSSWKTHEEQQEVSESGTRKLRVACDACHHGKAKCSRGAPCTKCSRSGEECVYSRSNRTGRPKGTRNRRTLDLAEQQQQNPKEGVWDSNSSHISNATDGRTKSAISNPVGSPKTSAASNWLSSPQWRHYQNDTRYLDHIGPEDCFGMIPNFSCGSAGSEHDLTFTLPNSDASYDSSMLDFSTDVELDRTDLINALACSLGTSYFDGLKGISVKSSTISSTDSYQSIDPAAYAGPTTTTGSSTPSCNCSEHQAQLLIRMKEYWKRSPPPPIDVVLKGAQEAVVSWESYIQCHVCQAEDDREVLLLAAMSIRAVLSLLQNVCSDTAIWDAPDYMGSISRRPDALAPIRSEAVASMPGGTKLCFGDYEIEGAERKLMLKVLVSKTVNKIRHLLWSLKEKCSRRGIMAFIDSQATLLDDDDGSTEYVQRLLGTMESTVQVLTGSLGCKFA